VAPMSSIHVEGWADECTTIAEIEDALIDLRFRVGDGDLPDLRTSVLTHLAWVPVEWRDAATEALAGLGARHPSRTLLLFPEPDSDDRLSAHVYLECQPLEGDARQLCNEVVELRLQGTRSQAPASIAEPLLLADLPVFLRWRGRPPFATDQFRQLVELADRLIIDSAEWPDVPGAYEELAGFFETAAFSDIAWRRTLRWREALASEWPEVPDRLSGPPAESALVAGWLQSRAGVVAAVEPGDELPHAEKLDASDLLSEELDVFGRDPVYEGAVRSAGRL
jgi:Glucose-6-phosphate dehydrogenase subunit